MSKEAKARIKINKLLEDAGWRFFDNDEGNANISLENQIKVSQQHIDAMGEDFEKSKNGFVDYLLLDSKQFPVCVLEAKKEEIHPLSAKEQARKYAENQKVRFIILSNGNLHYFWDLHKGNPETITRFPSQISLEQYKGYQPPDKDKFVSEVVGPDYVALTQNPYYSRAGRWQNPNTRADYITENKLKFLRPYQVNAIRAVQQQVRQNKERFLWEMATGTGKTLTAAAIIKLFLRTSNATRVLFLVDRLELESQAQKAFMNYLKNDYLTVIYKEKRDDWRKAEIVVTTVQSLLFNNKYKTLFSPTDFDLVISDEAHRSIGGNSRAVFEYFLGYKLGLTATPKDYLKKFDTANPNDPREYERRLLMDTYTTFGCDSGQPTFRYSLIDGVKDGFLINPIVVDGRTEITTQLLSDEGYSVLTFTDNAEEEEAEVVYKHRDFEKKFFSEETNKVFCNAFLEKALHDPITGEIGKSIIFCVSQNHAMKITQILNVMADKLYPGKYNSDFALQVTSIIPDAQQFTINFANNNLNGETRWKEGYKSSKTRVCVTVGMMTTGYDCEDILNIVLLRPIFSPSDFIQIKGRGTRKFDFKLEEKNFMNQKEILVKTKERFKLFDFFANCEYFEEKFNYDEIIKLPTIQKPKGGDGGTEPPPQPPVPQGAYESAIPDKISKLNEQFIGFDGMKIDRMFFSSFEDNMKQDDYVKEKIADGVIDESLLGYVFEKYMNKPKEFYTTEKLGKALQVDRKISLQEILEHIFLGNRIKQKDELLEDEFDKFMSIYKPENADIIALKYYFKAYLVDDTVKKIIDSKDYTELYHNPTLSIDDFSKVDTEMRTMIPDYINTYVNNNPSLK
jgi:type I restriction enzyme R subunit